MKKLSIIRNFAISCTILLAGCSTTPAPVTQRVKVPIPVPCVTAGAVPVKPIYQFHKLPASSNDGEKVIALAIDWLAGRKYEGELEAAIASCQSE